MLFSAFYAATAAALLTWLCSAAPTPVDVVVGKTQHDMVYGKALELAHQPRLEKRLSADFEMTRMWKNEVLFAGSWGDQDDSGVAESVSLAVTCVDCYTKGRVIAKLTDETLINPTVRLEFHGVEADVDTEIAVSAGATYAIELFASSFPIGLGFPGLSVGVVFHVDLVFSVTDQIDLKGGFYVKLDDSAYLEASMFGGEITDHFLLVEPPSRLIRLRVQCGAETELFGFGAGAELGIYANLIEFVAVLDSTPTCALQSSEWWDLNVGAFAHADVVIDYTTIGAIPTVSTTLLSAPTSTQCWIQIDGAAGGSPAETGGYFTATAISVPVHTVPTVSFTISSPAETGGYPDTTTGGSLVLSGTASISLGGGYTETLTTVTFPTITASSYVSQSGSLSTSAMMYSLGNSSVPAVDTGAPESPGEDDLVTSTVYSTTVYTITSCAASVVNCPASYQQVVLVTQTVDTYTIVCPATAVVTPPSKVLSATASSSTSGSLSTVDAVVITDVVVLVPCASPIVESFIAASSLIPPAAHIVTATVIAVSSSPFESAVQSSYTAAASPFIGGGKNAQWNNGTTAYSTTANGAGTAR